MTKKVSITIEFEAEDSDAILFVDPSRIGLINKEEIWSLLPAKIFVTDVSITEQSGRERARAYMRDGAK